MMYKDWERYMQRHFAGTYYTFTMDYVALVPDPDDTIDAVNVVDRTHEQPYTKLIADAARATEVFTEDELEAYAAQQRKDK